MCLAIPGKIKKIEGSRAFFEYDGNQYHSDISLAPRVVVGDWVLSHDGRALSKISEAEAKENLEFIEAHKEMHRNG